MTRIGRLLWTLIVISSLTACGEEAADRLLNGGCAYDAYQGTCYGEADRKFHFVGIINGAVVSYPDNELGPRDVLEEGESMGCSLKWAPSRKVCTPCIFDIGSCGQQAWDGF